VIQAGQATSPVVLAGARAMLKPVEPVGVSDYQRPPHDGRQSLEELVAVPAHPQVLVHPDRLPVPAVHAVAQQPQADGEPLAVCSI